MTMTNREWLKTLTDDELLNNIYICCIVMHDGGCPEVLPCRECQREWLNAEHKEVENDK